MAVADAVDCAEVMLFCLSLAYKESANVRCYLPHVFVSSAGPWLTDEPLLQCRLEANYAHQQNVDMIPLLMQTGYIPRGWLGLLTGTRLYYSFCDNEMNDESAFSARMAALMREIGGRCKQQLLNNGPSTMSNLQGAVRTASDLPTPTPTLPKTADVTESSFTPSVQWSPPATNEVGQGPAVESAGALEMARLLLAHEERRDSEIREEMRRMRLQMEELLSAAAHQHCVPPSLEIDAAQVGALQVRLAALHTAELLRDEELHALEDVLADYHEFSFLMGAGVTADRTMMASGLAALDKVRRMVGVSTGIGEDVVFARQCRRKFVPFGSESQL
eukprot:SAG31_NODE_3037_length_4761_cov_2.884384_3_plen_332_part_00